MALPRSAVFSALVTALEAITQTAGFNFTVITVFQGNDNQRQFNISDLPVIFIDPGIDSRLVPETFGAGTNNSVKRSWAFKIIGILPPGGFDDDVDANGELFIADIVKQLYTKRSTDLKDAGINWIDLETIEAADNFQRAENLVARIELNIRVVYEFRPANL
jgi:hypothetical protein